MFHKVNIFLSRSQIGVNSNLQLVMFLSTVLHVGIRHLRCPKYWLMTVQVPTRCKMDVTSPTRY